MVKCFFWQLLIYVFIPQIFFQILNCLNQSQPLNSFCSGSFISFSFALKEFDCWRQVIGGFYWMCMTFQEGEVSLFQLLTNQLKKCRLSMEEEFKSLRCSMCYYLLLEGLKSLWGNKCYLANQSSLFDLNCFLYEFLLSQIFFEKVVMIKVFIKEQVVLFWIRSNF